jgi:hypothetical protein
MEQHRQLVEVERRHKAEIVEANDLTAGLRRALAKAEADVKELEREAFEAVVICICQEAEQEATEYIMEALAVDARYKRLVALNAMLQITGKRFDPNLDLGFARGQVGGFSVPKFALEVFGKWGYGAPDHFVCSAARVNINAEIEVERQRFSALGAEIVAEASRYRKAEPVPFAKGA